eukprot:scaffold41983_cov27-Attheya_sp.AAC.1
MLAFTSTIANLKATHEEKLEKYKRDLSNQVKSDVTISTANIITHIDPIDAKVFDVETDIQGFKLNVDDLEAFQEDVAPKIDKVIQRPDSSFASADTRNDFLHFSCYMGTPTNLHPTVLPTAFSKFLLSARTLATEFLRRSHHSSSGKFMKTVKDMQSSADDPPLLARPFDFIGGLQFAPKDFSDDSTGLPPEQGLFSLANHTISEVGRFMKNLKDMPTCGNDPPLMDRFFYLLGGLWFAPKDFFNSSLLLSTIH